MGDLLVEKNPSWQWASGSEKKRNSNLKPDKQNLVFRNAECKSRASMFSMEGADFERDEGDFVLTHIPGEEIDSMVQAIDELDLGNEVITEDDATATDNNAIANENGDGNGIVLSRTYDISITYNNYYRSAHMWFIGKDERDEFLQPEKMFEDIMPDYRDQTITIENHPHIESQYKHLSIHPCKHALTMNNMRIKSPFPVEEYFFIFLKFVQSVVPTIEYDFTRAVRG